MGSTPSDIDVADLPGVWSWMRETARTDADLFWRLARPNRQVFAQMWGKGMEQDRPKGVPRAWTWRFRNQGLHWVITTGDEGSIYSLQLPPGSTHAHDPRVATGALAFLQNLAQQLTSLDE